MVSNKKPLLLDLFCGGGGAAKGYQRAGFYVIGVDNKPQPNYCGDAFYLGDALESSIYGFDAIHASPPCQKYTKKVSTWGRKRTYNHEYEDLLSQTRELLQGSGLPYVIENVEGSPLNGTVMLCGTMFGLRIIKHRFFEVNFDMPLFSPAVCNHKDVYNPWQGANRTAVKMREAMGIDWLPMAGGNSRKDNITGDLYNAIPPAYTEYIGKYLINMVRTT